MIQKEVSLEDIYLPSQEIVSREIEGEIVIVPLVSGIGDMEDELYTLNETGKAIWDRLDGENQLIDIVTELSTEFEISSEALKNDVIGFISELIKRKIVVEAPRI